MEKVPKFNLQRRTNENWKVNPKAIFTSGVTSLGLNPVPPVVRIS